MNKTHGDVLTDHSNIIFSTKCRIIVVQYFFGVIVIFNDTCMLYSSKCHLTK